MWPMGHVAVAYLCLVAFDRFRGVRRPDDVAVLIVVFAALLPDLVDKPLAWYLGALPSGRSLMHSLVVLVPLCLAVGALAWYYDRPVWGMAFAIGVLSHAILDALPALWREDTSIAFLFYPIVTVESYGEEGAPGVWALLLDSLGDPYFLVEFPLLAIAGVFWYRHGMPGLARIRTVVDRGQATESE